MKPSRKHFKLPRAGHGVRVSTGDRFVTPRIKSDMIGVAGARQVRISAACARGRHSQCFMLSCVCDCNHGWIEETRL